MCKYLLDTNVCMHNPEFLISKPQQAEYYITSTTIEELGKL